MDYNQFKKNPVSVIAFMMVLGVGYLYIDIKDTMQSQIDDLKAEVVILKAENKELTNKYVELAKSINQ